MYLLFIIVDSIYIEIELNSGSVHQGNILQNTEEMSIFFFSPNALGDVETHSDDEENSGRFKRAPWRRRLRFRVRLRRIRIRARRILKKLACHVVTTSVGGWYD